MTTDTLSRPNQRPSDSPNGSLARIALDVISFAFRPWASLKLTVVLFALAILLIFIGTLAQVTMDMWEVISLYFRAWLSWIEVKVLFPASWFPKMPEQAMRTITGMGFLGCGLAAAVRCAAWRSGAWWWRISLAGVAALFLFQTVLAVRYGAFWFPGGATIGTLLAVNLLAAHLVRFKVQARGLRLLAGLAGVAVGAVTTWVVISSGHNPEGVQAVPIFSWASLWLWCKLALTGLALLNLGMLAAMWAQGSRRIIELVLMGLSGVLLTALSVWLWLAGDGAYLGDAGMRILWQLIQGGLAAAVVLVACILLFKRRGGIVLIHIGLALLMLGEWFVSWYAVEERLIIREGESANFALDIRETELAVVQSDFSPSEEDVLGIPRSRLLHSSQRGELIRHPDLPFDVQVTQYLKNSDLRRPRADEKNLATAGNGLTWLAEELRPGSGADSSGQVDMSSAYVTLTEKGSGKPIGTYLVSQLLTPPQFSERVSVGGKTYNLALRFKHTYKPYSMQLVDVRKDDYIGTSTPKNYSSDVRLVDSARNVDRKVRIWMNNPLRYAGETFYQSGYNQDPRTGVETTTLQVVTNTGWMIPYVACMFVWFGMQSHFSSMLLRFLTRRDEELLAQLGQDVVPAALVTPVKEPEGRRGKRRRQRTAEQQPRAKASSGGVMFPAVVVLIFGGWLASQARPQRVADDDFDLAAFAKLPVVDQGRVKPVDTLARMTLAKISDRETYLDKDGNKQSAVRWFLDIVAKPPEGGKPSPGEQHRVFRIQNLEVLQMLGLERRQGFRYSLEEIRHNPEKLAEFDKELRATRQVDVAKMDVYQRKLMDLNNRFQTYLRLLSAFQPWDMPPFPSDKEMAADRDAALRGWIARVMSGGDQAEQEMDSMQAPLAVPRLATPGPQLESASQAARSWQPYATAYNRAYLQNMLGQPADSAALAWHAIFEAYRTGDAKAFNREVTSYRERLAATPPDEYVPRKVGLEAYMSSFGPLTFCMVLYGAAFVLAACAWLGWSRPLNRASFAVMLLAFLLHSAALVGRMYISGRPPVTNLYSSAVFIGWSFALAGLALDAIFRLGVCNAVAAVGGVLALMVAWSLGKGADTYTVMQAVLDTQFWLATHVVIVALGYAATFLAGLLGVVFITMGVYTWICYVVQMFAQQVGIGYITFKILNPSMWAADMRQVLSRMIYGVICFAALFSFVGTVLGGLWADDSWGRFWGWDPKENGALIIVLWNALILHALWGKMVRERGLAVLAVAGNIVTAWSWFGVNELGVGLHSYGFTEGVLLILGVFVATQLALMAVGTATLSWWVSFRNSDQVVLAEAAP